MRDGRSYRFCRNSPRSRSRRGIAIEEASQLNDPVPPSRHRGWLHPAKAHLFPIADWCTQTPGLLCPQTEKGVAKLEF